MTARTAASTSLCLQASGSGVAAIEIPKAAPAPETPRVATPVLIVDDEPGILSLIHTALRFLGYAPDVAANVAEAQERLRSRPYAVVICDYEMPGGNGFELLEYLHRVHPGLPFIMLTAHDEVDLARHAIAAGALDFVAKPFEIRQLKRVIEQNLERRQQEQERAARLTTEVLTGTIRALVAAVDAKDPHTASHSERVTRIASVLGKAAGLPEPRLRVLEFAALLHDVGKIGVPERILLKPGRLEPDEWEVFKQHPVRSAQIVREVGQLSEVAHIVLHHHERVDGAGYPDGLSGEAIPPLSRLIAIADAYEAMTSDRSYRNALGPARAREEIRAALGSHFDPHLGEVFLSLEHLP